LNPFAGVKVMTAVPGSPGLIVTLDGAADSVKLPAAAPTFIESGADVDVEKFASPPYFAVIEPAPTGSVVVEKVVEPEPFSVPVPRVVAPLANVTVPVGTFVPLAGATPAINVTLAPEVAVAGPVSVVVVETNAAAFIVSMNAGEVLAWKFVSPLYCAVMDCEPTGSIVVESVAIPPAPTVKFPTSTPTPSENVTVPEIVPAVPEVTVAVSVTFVPNVAGFGEAVTTVVVLALAAAFIVSVSMGEVLAAKFASPLYCTVMECAPAVRLAVVSVALPAAPIVTGAPICVAPSKNVAVPVIVPAVAEVTVAVNITLAPTVDGFRDDVTVVVVAGRTGAMAPFSFSRTTLPTIKSGLPSPFRSVAIVAPVAWSTRVRGAETVPSGFATVWNVPLPLPGKIPPKDSIAPPTKRSSFPSWSKFARAMPLTNPNPSSVKIVGG
jgi:hypothetical protein